MEDIAKTRLVYDKPFHFRILNEKPDWETEDYYKSTGMRDAVTAAIAATGITLSDIRTRLLYETSPEASDPNYRGYLFPLLQVMIQIDDDNWLELTQPMVLTDYTLIRTQSTLILLGSLVISLVTILLIRKATKPLSKLGQTAEMFGRNPEAAHPLEEEGSFEIREATQSFNRMRKRICDNLKERDNMLEAMGHDLRTPLARIQLRMDKIQPDSLREKFAGNFNEIQSIIEQGLELARSLHSSERALPLDIVAFVEIIADDMEAQGEQVSLADIPGNDAPALLVMARPISLKRSVENILSNAVKYGGNARISVTKDGNNVMIDIDDDGPGIPEDMLEKVFEPYYRLEYSRNRDSGGTGLGLPIARNMVLLNNGSIVLSNRAEGGFRARITIPHLKTPNPKSGS
jgi:signal transduction histidine kinase